MITYEDIISAQERLTSKDTKKKLMDIQDKICDDIKTQIQLGILSPGKKLSENILADHYNCSRTPVREALQELQRDGYIIIQPKSGTYVRMHTVEETKEATQVRAYLEACAFSLIIKKDININPLIAIFNNLEEIREAKPFKIGSFGALHVQFHSCLVSLSQNNILIDFYQKLHLSATEKLFFNPMTKEDIDFTQNEHAKIIKYLQEKDLEGEKFIINHLLNHQAKKTSIQISIY